MLASVGQHGGTRAARGPATRTAHAQPRMEVIPIDSMTLTLQQILTGEMQGKPVTIAGELRLPRGGTDELPAVILVHAWGGVLVNLDDWARVLNSWGVAVFIQDSLSGRGIVGGSAEDGQLSGLSRMIDSYRSLARLAQHPRIDPNRIAVMGFSYGTVVALWSSSERFRKLYGPPNTQFAAHIGLYAFCVTRYRDDDKVTGRPIRLFHGTGDDWNSIEPCRAYVARLKTNGADATLTEFPGATHAYDITMLKERGPSESRLLPPLLPRRRGGRADHQYQDGQAVRCQRSVPRTGSQHSIRRGRDQRHARGRQGVADLRVRIEGVAIIARPDCSERPRYSNDGPP